MRRISLAVALMGAVAAAGCGGGGKPSSTAGAKGTAGSTFTVTVQNGQNGNTSLAIKGGAVVSSPAGINCGVGIPLTGCSFDFPVGTTVTLTATPSGNDPNYKDALGNSLPYQFFGWAGDCQGEGTCSLSGNADKYVVVIFAGQRAGHPNWSAGNVHGPKYWDLINNVPGTLNCLSCHGAKLQGQGLAVSCQVCHSTGVPGVGGHFDATKAAWGNHGTGWSSACQRCHTSDGFLDYVGADGSATYNVTTGTFGAITATATTPPGGAGYANGPLKCATCHNPTTDPGTAGITQVQFPSRAMFDTDKSTAICGQCHGARESTVSMDALIATQTPTVGLDLQIAAAGVSFKNPHYLGAAATLFGADAKGWAQYPNMVYTAKNQHGGVAGCTYCHDAHTGDVVAKVNVATCGKCHFTETGAPVGNFLELEESRQFGFEGDIDGDGVQESLKLEIDGLAAKLTAAIQAYAFNVVGQGVCFDNATYPYFLKHTSADGSGACSAAEITLGSNGAFKAFTPRLMRAAYNLKFYAAEPGAWAHNPRYAIEVMYDAIIDLNAGLTAAGKAPVVFSGKRSFNGHFGAADFAPEPYAQFLYHPAVGAPTGTPGTGFPSATCYQCHGGEGGYAKYLSVAPFTTNLVTTDKVTGMQCTTCHQPAATDAKFTTMRSVPTLFVPPQKDPADLTKGVVSFASTALPKNFALCATCHSGLENMASVDAKIAAMVDPAAFTASFVNGHYLGAAAIILGGDAKALYQYTGKTYQGKAVNWSVTANGPYGSPHGAACVACHVPQGSKHTFEIDTAKTVVPGTYHGAPNTQACDGCHVDARPFGAGDYRLAPPKARLQLLANALLDAIKAYALANNTGKAICYDQHSYPYFLNDGNGNGVCDAPAETARTNAYLFNATLLKAAYNYQWFVKEPGAAEHNYIYVAEALYDSILDLGGTIPNDPATLLPIVRP